MPMAVVVDGAVDPLVQILQRMGLKSPLALLDTTLHYKKVI